MEEPGLNLVGMRQLLGRYEALADHVLAELNELYADAWYPGRPDVLLPRDHSWNHACRAVDELGLCEQYDPVWLNVTGYLRRRRIGGVALLDALAATLLDPVAGRGPFGPGDRDLLLAPWRAVVDRCSRSRLALDMARGRTGPVDDAWWAVVDAVLAP